MIRRTSFFIVFRSIMFAFGLCVKLFAFNYFLSYRCAYSAIIRGRSFSLWPKRNPLCMTKCNTYLFAVSATFDCNHDDENYYTTLV